LAGIFRVTEGCLRFIDDLTWLGNNQSMGEIAKSLGYEVMAIELFRTRLATATKEQLREEVLVLRWPGTE
jgi:hypothetical protein